MNIAGQSFWSPMPSSFESVTVQACVRGFVSAVGYHFASQGYASVCRFGAVTTLEHRNDVEHPWPRVFRFKLELLVEEGATAAEIDKIYRHVASDPRVECVVNLLVTDPAGLVEELTSLGFMHAFDKALMARSLGAHQLPRESPENLHVRKVDTPALVAQTILLGQDHRSQDAVLEDRQIHDFIAFRDGAVAATAQFVTTDYRIAYVSRMFTAPEHRQTGCCRALLHTMQAEARALGMTHSVLVPSLMAWELGIYEKLGYRLCNPMSLMIREQP
jgi:GNAT superfamily N-acetyltransferase